MAKLSGGFLRRSSDHLMFWCPGCKCAHVVNINHAKGRPAWAWNGNETKPTLRPSVRCYTPEYTDSQGKKHPQFTLCHLFLVNGEIQFLGDCAHELKGKKVPLQPIGDDYGGLED